MRRRDLRSTEDIVHVAQEHSLVSFGSAQSPSGLDQLANDGALACGVSTRCGHELDSAVRDQNRTTWRHGVESRLSITASMGCWRSRRCEEREDNRILAGNTSHIYGCPHPRPTPDRPSYDSPSITTAAHVCANSCGQAGPAASPLHYWRLTVSALL